MEITISNQLLISDPTPEIIKFCHERLVLNNPEFYKKVALGKWTGNIPEKFFLYEKIGNTLRLPFGCLKDIWKMHPIKSDYSFQICPVRRTEYQSLINPYPYQEKAIVEAIRAKNGVLEMPCGSGKTQCGLEIISRIGGRALWLTHTADLLNQSMTRAKTVLMQGGYGTITGGRINIGTHITFATIQTMVRLDLERFKNEWDIIIIDEAQHCCGTPTRATQFYKVVSALSARYKFGLTATPKRGDGLQAEMFALLGGIIHKVTREDVAHTTCPIKVQAIETGYIPEYDAILQGDGTIDYMKLIDNLIHDKTRKEIVMTEILAHENEPTMVLANRVEYLDELTAEYNKICDGRGLCLSSSRKKDRKEALERLNNGELGCLFATYQLAAEGLDVPNLRYMIFATPEKNETTITQAAGRVGRKAEGKEYGTVIDFIDDFGMYRNWFKERKKCYKKIKAEVQE